MKVKFVPQNVEFDIKPGQPVMHVAQDHGIYIKSVCKGVPSCAECRVRVVEGEHNVLPPGSEELSLIGTGHFIDRRRLSCQLKCFGDITVDLSEQVAKEQGVGKKSKRAMQKNDRVEEAVAIRSEEFNDDKSSEAPPPREPRGNRERPPREPRNQNQNAAAAAGPGSGAGENQSANQKPRRNQKPNQRQPNEQRQKRAQQNPGVQGQGKPRQAEGAAIQDAAPRETGEGGGQRKRRRRRRGGGSGGNANPNAGAPTGAPKPQGPT